MSESIWRFRRADEVAPEGSMLTNMGWLVPVEPVNIRWCMSHRRETWSGRTTCVGMGGDLTNSCNVVDALLMVGEDSTP